MSFHKRRERNKQMTVNISNARACTCTAAVGYSVWKCRTNSVDFWPINDVCIHLIAVNYFRWFKLLHSSYVTVLQSDLQCVMEIVLW